MLDKELIMCICGSILGVIISPYIYKLMLPILIKKTTKIIEKNPKWIVSKLRKNYYGLSDMDIIIVNSPIGVLPRFHINKKNNKLELLISEDVSTKDIEDIATLALRGKLYIYHSVNLTFTQNKSASYLSMLYCMINGGNIVFKK